MICATYLKYTMEPAITYSYCITNSTFVRCDRFITFFNYYNLPCNIFLEEMYTLIAAIYILFKIKLIIYRIETTSLVLYYYNNSIVI